MIPPINIPPAAREAAYETREEIKKAAKERTAEFRRAFSSFYSQVNCTDLSAIAAIQAPDCAPLRGGSRRDMEDAVALDWRADPFVSMSDLTLLVYDGSGDSVPYHAHTLLLAYGGRKSGFVAEQIKSQHNKVKDAKSNSKSNFYAIQRQNSSNSHGSSGSASKAEYKVDVFVPPLAARHVPLFLDYVYGSPPDLATATAPALRYLSNRFDCRDLHREVTSRFIPQDLELNTAPQYCTMADELKDFELRDRSVRIMAERFERMDMTLLRNISPRMLRGILQCERLACEGRALSEKVAQYLRMRDKRSRGGDGGGSDVEWNRNSSAAPAEQETDHALTDEDFYWLTHCQHMPKVSPKEAIFYLNYGTQYPQVMNEVGSGSLKSRCLAACSDGWAIDQLASHLENTDRNPLELYESLEMKMKVQLLESALLGARRSTAETQRGLSLREEDDRDVRLSDEIMYKNIKERSPPGSNVERVLVLGCGAASANGMYLANDDRTNLSNEGAPAGCRHQESSNTAVYEKEAVRNGHPVTFVLYPKASGKYYTQYKLGVRERNGQTRVLYNSPMILRGVDVGSIPESEWEVEGDDDQVGGVLRPPPRFVGRVDRPTSLARGDGLMHSV